MNSLRITDGEVNALRWIHAGGNPNLIQTKTMQGLVRKHLLMLIEEAVPSRYAVHKDALIWLKLNGIIS